MIQRKQTTLQNLTRNLWERQTRGMLHTSRAELGNIRGRRPGPAEVVDILIVPQLVQGREISVRERSLSRRENTYQQTPLLRGASRQKQSAARPFCLLRAKPKSRD